MKLIAGDVTLEGANIEEIKQLSEVYRDLEPLIYGDLERPPVLPGKPKEPAAEMPAGAKRPTDKAEERRLADEYKAKTGTRFMYRPETAHRGKTKLQVLQEALAS